MALRYKDRGIIISSLPENADDILELAALIFLPQKIRVVVLVSFSVLDLTFY